MAPSRGRSDSPDLERLAHLIHVPFVFPSDLDLRGVDLD